MESNFIIPLSVLAQGHTGFAWSIRKDFFTEFGNAEIIDANLSVEADVEKSGQYLGIDCKINGTVTVPCDRCLGNLECPVDAIVKLSIKYGVASDGMDEGEREVICLPANDTDLDMAQTIYDYACLSLPIQRVHEDGACDPETVKHLGLKRTEEEQGAQMENNPFTALKGMFGN
ncbi:MAG: YceD family protein [Bacteroidales bacterium]|nr:YceD family protein [Bacteroidales bacterium]